MVPEVLRLKMFLGGVSDCLLLLQVEEWVGAEYPLDPDCLRSPPPSMRGLLFPYPSEGLLGPNSIDLKIALEIFQKWPKKEIVVDR